MGDTSLSPLQRRRIAASDMVGDMELPTCRWRLTHDDLQLANDNAWREPISMNVYNEARNDTSDRVARRSASLLLMPALMLAVSLLAGCAQVTRSGNAGQTQTQSPTPSPSTRDSMVMNGCPSKLLPADRGVFHPDVTVTYSLDQGAAQPVALTHGQVLEIHLIPNVQWGLTITDTDHALQGSTPAGWYDTSANACAWRFAANTAGAAHLAFKGPVLCPPNIHCTAVLEQAAFDVTVH